MKLFALGMMLTMLAFAGGCEDSASRLPLVEMKIGTRTYHLEVARTEAQQEKGLMKRDSMPANHGMIFVFPDEQERSFWMKDTRFPLDIVFLNSGGQVVSIHQMRAYDLHNTPSDAPAQYAIELNKGQAKDSGVRVGDQLQIPAQARADYKERPATRP